MRDQIVKRLAGRTIFCSVTRQALDARACVVLLDTDGDPRAVLSQEGWCEVLARVGEKHAAERGLFVDPETVRS